MENIIKSLSLVRTQKTFAVLGALAIILGIGADKAHAQNLIANPSFENPTLTPGTFLSVASPGNIGAWQVVGPNVVLLQNTYAEISLGVNGYNAQDGLNSLDLTGGTNINTTGVTQNISTLIGTSYNVSFYVGRVSGNVGTFANPATADLSINNGVRTSFTNSNLTPGGVVNWQQFSTSFLATSSTTSITFYNGSPAVTNYVGLDNVSVTAAAPEPATLSLLALGGFGGLAVARRRRKG